MSTPKPKSRLGRGLSSLMNLEDAPSPTPPTPVMAELPAVTGTPLELQVKAIRPNPHQPRRHFDDVALDELARSIAENGVLQPILVRQAPEGHYELIAGERRLRAARKAGLALIPAYVRSVDDLAQAQMALVENLQRDDLNPIERAQGYLHLTREMGLSQQELATRLGEDRSSINHHLRLLDLPEEVQELVREGSLSLGHAKVLAGLSDPAEQLRLARLVVSQGLSVRNLERVVASPSTPVARKAEPAPSAHLKNVETSMTQQLGLRVQIRTGANRSKGKVVISYGSLDEFDTLVERLGVKLDD